MPYARQCDQCKEVIPPRGGDAPRFCPHCGARLSSAPVESTFESLTSTPKTPGTAFASLICGVLSLIPMGGLPLAIAAIVLGVHTHRRIQRTGGTLGGAGLATAGTVLGVLSLVFQLALCRRLA